MSKGGLGNMPLTLWVLVAAVILYLYIRRASLGIDTHPGEGRSVTVKPPPSVLILPPAGGIDWSRGPMPSIRDVPVNGSGSALQ